MHKLLIPILTLFLSFSVVMMTAEAESKNQLIVVPTKNTVTLGDEVEILVALSSTSQAVNAVSGSISIPQSMAFVRISKSGSVVNFWTQEPRYTGGKVVFEGVMLNPGYQGSKGVLFSIVVRTKNTGATTFVVKDGALLANDGLGTNILDTLGSATIVVKKQIEAQEAPVLDTLTAPPLVYGKPEILPLPVITEYSSNTYDNMSLYIKGRGAPNMLTKIFFIDNSFKSLGEQFIGMLQTKKIKLDSVLVKNDSIGVFQYVSPQNLVAGVYNATPYLVDESTSTEKPGLGVQLLVNDSKIVRALVVAINVLGLLIPVVGLLVLVYFIPWYSWRKMRVLKREMSFEEEKIEMSEHQLLRNDKLVQKTADDILASKP